MTAKNTLVGGAVVLALLTGLTLAAFAFNGESPGESSGHGTATMNPGNTTGDGTNDHGMANHGNRTHGGNHTSGGNRAHGGGHGG